MKNGIHLTVVNFEFIDVHRDICFMSSIIFGKKEKSKAEWQICAVNSSLMIDEFHRGLG